jgi:hypothetical protein
VLGVGLDNPDSLDSPDQGAWRGDGLDKPDSLDSLDSLDKGGGCAEGLKTFGVEVEWPEQAGQPGQLGPSCDSLDKGVSRGAGETCWVGWLGQAGQSGQLGQPGQGGVLGGWRILR